MSAPKWWSIRIRGEGCNRAVQATTAFNAAARCGVALSDLTECKQVEPGSWATGSISEQYPGDPKATAAAEQRIREGNRREEERAALRERQRCER